MQITLNQDEIVEAVKAYVYGQIAVAPGQTIEVDLKAGRGENGFTATLDIRPASLGIPSLNQRTPQESAVAAVTNTQFAAAVPSEPVVVSEPVAVKAAEPTPAKATASKKASGIFGNSIKAEAPAPLKTEEPVGALEEVVLPQQDPENLATMSSELDDAMDGTNEEELPAEPSEAPAATTSIFKFAKG